MSIPVYFILLTEGEYSLPYPSLPLIPAAFLMLGGGVTAPPVAHFGELRIEVNEGPLPGTDTGWNRFISIEQTRNLGAVRDHVLQTALGSHERQFQIFLSRDRFLQFQAIQGTVMPFTDWNDDERSVYVVSVRRDSGSRPFYYLTTIVLLEH